MSRNCRNCHIINFKNGKRIYARSGVELTKKFNEVYPLDVKYTSLKNIIIHNDISRCRLKAVIDSYKRIDLFELYKDEIDQTIKNIRTQQRMVNEDGTDKYPDKYKKTQAKIILKKLYDRDTANDRFNTI